MSRHLLCALLGSALLTAPARAEITVGFVTALSGPASSIGILYGNGIAAAFRYRDEVSGETIRLIRLDDASDPSTATRNARKLIEENRVDLLIGTSSAPSTIAMAAVATELHVPLIAISPITVSAGEGVERWTICVPQPAPLMIKSVTDRMQRDGARSIGFIGFSDAWGDLVFNGTKAAQASGQINITTDQRYTRTDTSVTGQILRLLATKPDGVLNGGSATQGALPLLSLMERGYKGKLYGNPALVNADFIRVAGKAANGIELAAGPVIVAEQLPDDHFAKHLALTFRDVYRKVNGVPTTDAFSSYAFDAWLIFTDAARRALPKAKPGTAEFRKTLKDEIFRTKELPGTQAVYNYSPESSYGADSRSLVMMRLVDGTWTYAP